MIRKDIIKQLHKIKFRAIPMVLTMDLGMQYDYMSSEGAGSGLLAMIDWPAYKFQGITQEKWTEIKQALKEKTLNDSTLKGTGLEKLVERMNKSFSKEKDKHENVNAAFSGLLNLPDKVPTTLYCLCDPDNELSDYRYPSFYEKEADLLRAFNDTYCLNYTKWEDMDDEDLSYWFERLNDDMDAFPYYCI